MSTSAIRDSHRPAHRLLAGMLAIAAFSLLAILAPPASAQLSQARVSGTVVDEEGNPVEDIALVFTPQGETAKLGKALKVKKKGKFSHSFFPAGSFVVTLDESDLFLKSMEYVLRSDTGQELNRIVGDAHPKEGLPTIRIPANHKVELNFVVASKESLAKLTQQVATFEAKGKLKKISDLYAQRDMEGVVAEADALLAEEPDLGAAVYLRGAALWQLGRLEEAEQTMRRATELVPEQEGIWGVMGTVMLDRSAQLEENGQTDEAIAMAYEAAGMFEKDLEQNPGAMASLINRAAALDQAEKDDELEQALHAVIEADPENVQATARLVTMLIRSGRREEALELLEGTTGGDATIAAALFNVAVNFYNDNDLETAERAARKAVEIAPDLAEVHRLLARIHLGKQEKAAAITEIEKYLELAPDASDAAVERQLLEALKKQEAAQ